MNKDIVDYYDSIAAEYDESRFNNSYGKFIDTQERRILDKLIAPASNGSRLEIACGTGRLTNYATHGLDASEEMMTFAEKRHPDVTFVKASACETGFPDETFGIVYSFHLLMHLDVETISRMFEEVHRILAPGGRFIFDIPSKKRRNLLRHKQESWHGATSMDKSDVLNLAQKRFKLQRRLGIMMLPVHKLPVRIRKVMTGFDYAMANSFLKSYSSYLVYELTKI